MAFQAAVGFALVIATIWQCEYVLSISSFSVPLLTTASPVRAFWVFPPMPGAKCLDEGKVTLGCGIVNSFADLITTIIPIPMIMRLKMPMARRIGVNVLLGVGFIVTCAGAVRSYFVWKALIDSYDETWYCYGLWISAAVEIDLGVVSDMQSWDTVLHMILMTFHADMCVRARTPTILRLLLPAPFSLHKRALESWLQTFKRVLLLPSQRPTARRILLVVGHGKSSGTGDSHCGRIHRTSG
jgi:hypothetical protein